MHVNSGLFIDQEQFSRFMYGGKSPCTFGTPRGRTKMRQRSGYVDFDVIFVLLCNIRVNTSYLLTYSCEAEYDFITRILSAINGQGISVNHKFRSSNIIVSFAERSPGKN